MLKVKPSKDRIIKLEDISKLSVLIARNIYTMNDVYLSKNSFYFHALLRHTNRRKLFWNVLALL